MCVREANLAMEFHMITDVVDRTAMPRLIAFSMVHGCLEGSHDHLDRLIGNSSRGASRELVFLLSAQ